MWDRGRSGTGRCVRRGEPRRHQCISSILLPHSVVNVWPAPGQTACACAVRAVGWNVTTLSPRRWSTRHSTIERVLKRPAAVGCFAAVAGASVAAARGPASNTVSGGGIQHHVREKWRGRPDIFLILPLPPASAAAAVAVATLITTLTPPCGASQPWASGERSCRGAPPVLIVNPGDP
jgi:hypothetical protein